MNKRNKRLLSAILAFMLLVTNLPVVTSASDSFCITCDGENISLLEFCRNEKKTVSAENLPGGCSYQWQIQVPGTDTWVNIQGQTSQLLSISYALVGSLLDSSQSANLRCAAVNAGEVTDHTGTLKVAVKEERTEKQETIPAAAVEAAPAPTEAAAVIEAAGITQETTVPVETEAVEETSAPAETEPATEPAEAVPETTVPVETEAVEETSAPAETEPATETVEAVPETTVPVETEAVEAPNEAAEPAPMLFAMPRSSAGEASPNDAAAVSESTEIVSVKIEYFYEDRNGGLGDMVMDPYTARIQKNDSLNVTVPCKVFPGYEIRLKNTVAGITLSNNEVTIDLDKVAANLTIVVLYKEIKVPYFARFFMQNVYNDLYTERTDILSEADKQDMMGYAGEQPEEEKIHPDVDGFSALFHQPDEIAADGSTVFEVYYDRNYYLINFDMDGGYGTAPVYARYETSFTVANPVKHGYTFNGWELVDGTVPDGSETDSNGLVKKIPASSLTYRAKWTQGATNYTVAYWILDDNDTPDDTADDTRTFLGSRKESARSGDPVSGSGDLRTNIPICGEDHSHESDCYVDAVDFRYMDYVKADQQVTVEGDGSTVVNVYYEYREYTLKFYYAMSSGSGDNTKYYVVGGSSYGFGADASSSINRDDEIDLLSQYLENGGWKTRTGSAAEMPTLNALGISRKYQTGFDEATVNRVAYKYHYISFKARYGDDISNLWPCDVFNSVTMNDGSTSWSSSNEAFVSAWNGEYNVYYSQVNKENQTIKGNYQKLDYQILWKDSDPSDLTVSYLCFWENGANVGWSIPELYIYNIWITCQVDKDGNPVDIPTDPQTAQPKATKKVQVKGHDTVYTSDDEYRWFYLDQSYHTCDDSNIAHQTRPSITGYSDPDGYRLTEWQVIFLTNASKSGNFYTGGGGTTYNQYTNQVKSGGWYQTQNLNVSSSSNDQYLLYSNDYDPQNPENGVDHSLYREAFSRDFYYYSNNHKLFYRNYDQNMGTGEGADVPYGKSLKVYGDYFSKEDMETKYYPKTLEPKAYYFDGWYTTPNFLPGTEMDWNRSMPDSDLIVYAKWSPVTYSTYFYLDYDRYQKRDPANPNDPNRYALVENTPHGTAMINPPKIPTYDNYQFVGWFYRDADGNKIAFNPSEMAVRKELHLYAEWSTKTVKQYTVSYALGEWDAKTKTVTPLQGNQYRKLSEDTQGYAFEASTRTFAAKSEDQLEKLTPEEKEHGIWVPHTNSHSILMNGENAQNTFTFWYVSRDNIPYTVRYLDSATGEPLLSDKTVAQNHAGVVTEQFLYIPGYIPDAFHKTLVLSANEEENVISFVYTKDKNHETQSARYLVTHYIQDLNPDTYSVYTTDDLIGIVGKQVHAEALDIPGFTFDHNKSNATKDQSGKYIVSGTVTTGEVGSEALKLELYYSRNQYSYTVQYLDADTRKSVRDVKTVKNNAFDSVITETAPDIVGYDLYGYKTQTLKISAMESQNVITFLYTPKALTVNYVPVCKTPGVTDFGDVNKTSEYKDIKGASAFAKPGFRFMGWYSDPKCTNKVSEDSFYKPDVKAAAGVYEYTYYALFEPIRLTITQTGMNDSDSGIYQLKNSSGTVIATVIVTGNKSVILEQVPEGGYTIEEIAGNWTWTYGDTKGIEFTVSANSSNTVSFQHNSKTIDWLHKEAAN